MSSVTAIRTFVVHLVVRLRFLLLVQSLHHLDALAVLPKYLLVLAQFRLVKTIVERDHVHQKVENLYFSNYLLYISALQSFTASDFGMERSSMCEFGYEHLASEGKQNRGFRRNHAHIFVRLHDLFNARKRQLLLLERIQIARLLFYFLSNFLKLDLQLL